MYGRFLTIYSLLVFSFAVNSFSQPSKEFKRTFKNGATFVESKKIPGLSQAFVVTTNYDNGRVLKTEEWRFGKRNGMTRVFNRDGSIFREIKFKDNFVLDYKAYKSGKIETQISEDRNTIFNKGKRVNVRWNKYYEIWSGEYIVSFDSKSLINYLLNFVVPEEATEVLGDISDFFDKAPGAGQGGKDDILTCGNGSSVFSDNNLDLNSLNSQGRQSATLQNTKLGNRKTSGTNVTRLNNFGSNSGSSTNNPSVLNIINTCSNNYRSAGAGSGGVGGMSTGRNNDINNARGTLDNMISGCRSNRGRSNLIASDPTTMFKSLQVAQALEAEAAATQIVNLSGSAITESASTITEVTTRSALMNATEGAAVRTGAGAALRGFTLVAVSNAIAGVATAAVTGWIIGTAINESVVGEAIEEAVAQWQESNDEEYQKAVAEADKAQKAAEARAEAKKQEESNNAPSSSGPAVSTPTPEGIGAGDPCERAERFKAYCDATQWRDLRCEDFIRMIKGCAGDVREIYVNPEGGGVTDVGCSSSGDPARIREAECKRRGLISMPGGSGGGMCASKKVEPVMGGPDPRVINPTRGDFSLLSSGMSNVRLIDDSQSKSSVLNSKKPTLVVFTDPDCGFCNSLSSKITSKNVSNALSGYDIHLVDANMSPKLLQEFNIKAVPSFFVAKSGKQSTVVAGDVTEQQLVNYLNDNKSGQSK